jgi:hypothetical protein
MTGESGASFDNRSHVVWLRSYSKEANEVIYRRVRPLTASHGRVKFVRTALAESLPQQPPATEIAKDPDLCAVVLVLERAGLDDDRYIEPIEWCVNQVSDRAEFRLFLAPYDLRLNEPQDLMELRRLGPTIKGIVEVVQFMQGEDIYDNLVPFLDRVDDFRDKARKERIWERLLRISTRGASIVQFAVALAVMAAAVDWNTGNPISASEPSMAFLLGLIIFPLLLYNTALFVKPSMLHITQPHSARIEVLPALLFVTVVLLMASTVALLPIIPEQPLWLAAGTVGGFLLDVLRRSRFESRLYSRLLHGESVTAAGEALPPPIRDAIGGRLPFVLHARVLPDVNARVFISYARKHRNEPMTWSHRWAGRLYDAFREAGIDCFLDRCSIQPGTDWLDVLRHAIRRANVVIALLDVDTLDRQWVAAELETALRDCGLTGAPDVYLLSPSDTAVAETWNENTTPEVFQAVLRTPLTGESVHMMTLWENDDVTLKMLISRLRGNRFRVKTAIVPGALEPIVRTVVALPVMPLLLLGSWGTLVGWPAVALAILQTAGLVDTASFLDSRLVLPVISLLSAFWGGFVARLAVASAFEVRMPMKGPVAVAHLLMALAFLLLVIQWVVSLVTLLWAWSVVVVGVGWLTANLFLWSVLRHREIHRDPDRG